MMSGPQPLQLQADANYAVTLQAIQWNGVLQALAKAPYEVAAPLIQAIGEQLQRQTGPMGPQPTAGNGLDVQPPTV
jgi:hypothetical protein